MRPLHKPLLATLTDTSRVKSGQLSGLLLATLGRYCSFCECFLEDPVFIQSKSSDKNKFSASEWPDLFLACADCNASAQQAYLDKKTFKDTGQSLWPDDSSYSFTLSRGTGNPTSPFQYVLQSVNIVSIDSTGARTSLPAQNLVVVKADATSSFKDQVTNIIKLYMLNTIYYDDATNTLQIPFADYSEASDQRIQERTDAWNAAIQATQQLQICVGAPVPYAMMAEQIAVTARYSGFWSSWMTVFWQAFKDSALLQTMFIAAAKSDDFIDAGTDADPTTQPLFFFPGTDATRITYIG